MLIRFVTYQDQVQGNYLLATKSVAHRFRGGIFDITETDRKLLDDQRIAFEIIPDPESREADQALRDSLTSPL